MRLSVEKWNWRKDDGDGKDMDEGDQVLKFGQILCEMPKSYPSRDAE